MKRSNLFLVPLVLLLAAPAVAQQEADEEERPEFVEVIVVTASRVEQNLHEVPSAVSVITSEQLEIAPADDVGDLMRSIPGLNVAKFGARDIQIAGRAATSSLATSQLVLIDNRTLYLDFFGFVMWDLVPIDTREIRQIEVVRGPGSAVWGANAMTGVINMITKAPHEMQGTSLIVGGGELSTAYGSVTHAGVRGSLGYKLSAGYYEQDSFDRPTGIVPGGTAEYPAFPNTPTEQPKGDVRFDIDRGEAGIWSFSGGAAATAGIIHSGIGPFDIDSSSYLAYGKVDWTRRAARLTLFGNFLDGEARNLLTVGPTGQPIEFFFDTQTYNLDYSDTKVFGASSIVTYGVNIRRNEFDLSLAPLGASREEWGFFAQNEFLISDQVRWTLGARIDDIDPIGSVFSPRTSVLYSPVPNHTFRFSYNRAFRAPSLINNFLEVTIIGALIPIDALGIQFPVISHAFGNPDLTEERLEAYEVGWVGSLGDRTTLTAALYRNEWRDTTKFVPATAYDPTNLPPGWPLPPEAILLFPPLPESFTYINLGRVRNEGIEISLDMRMNPDWTWFVNYSYQETPEVQGLPPGEFNIPPEHRFNVGASYNGPTFFASANVQYVDEAFWTDVLDARFFGVTDDYTQVNLRAGKRFWDGRATVSVNATNVFDEDIQQHVFGDIISRKVTGQLTLRF